MKVSKRLGIAGIVLILGFLFFAGSYFRYQQVNEPGKQRKIHEETLKTGEDMEDAGILFSFQKIKKTTVYDKDYQCKIDRYWIQIKARNISNEDFSLGEKITDHLILVSGGRKWYAEPLDQEKDVLKKKKSRNCQVQIDVIPEDNMDRNIYDQYTLYLVKQEGNGVLQYKVL